MAPTSYTTEKNFEDDVEAFLRDAGWQTFPSNAQAGSDYDPVLALKTRSLLDFIHQTQPSEWAKIEGLYGQAAEAQFLKRLSDVLEPRDTRGGLLATLRRGFNMAPGAHFRLCYFRPASTLNPEALADYRTNRFELVRQLHYGTLPDDLHNSVDTVLFLNGLPLVTLELKNNLSGQRTSHAVAQYKADRSPKELLFKPNRRSLVHFALDSETVEMTTRLAGADTVFLPFNRGNGRGGGGNPANPEGYRTEYLYREVLTPDSLLDIVQHFVRADPDPSTGALTRVIFPRYHQLDAVRRLVADARAHGAGHNYLIQHSAGSGKSNSIAWLAHRLHSLHDDAQEAIFDTVVVLTDRKNLDAQLSATIASVDHVTGVVKTITERDGSAGLRDALNSGAQIITSTIQKFPYICAQVRSKDKRYAVIIDEAHSSQSGSDHAKMKLALASREDADPDARDGEDLLAEVMSAQGPTPNISFFAFTATPKPATLEVFGTRDALCQIAEDGRPIPRPFHLYSMKQAIDEGYILDVLENYTCFATYFRLVKTVAEDPRFEEARANTALRRLVTWNPHLIENKARVIVEHFHSDVAGLLGGRSKAMVVTSSRRMALELYRAIRAYTTESGYALGTMIAFSGALSEGEGGSEVTEASLNGVPESRTAEVFDEDSQRIIVVANKFQTGFDQPKLCAMYVDKELSGVAAVQTLSRLNRISPIPGKRTFVLDFANDPKRIQSSFNAYYDVAELDTVTDPSVVYDLRERLEGFGIIDPAEVELVAEAYLNARNPDAILGLVEGRLSPAVDRWIALPNDEKRTFKALLRKFCRTYSFITQMVALGDRKLHTFFIYSGFLIRKLFLDTSPDVDLRDKVDVEYLRLEDRGTESIELEAEALHNGGADAGVTQENEQEYLSELVRKMNDAFGTDWRDADKILRAVADKILEDETFVAQARTNSVADLRAVFPEQAMNALLAIVSDSQDMAAAFNADPNRFISIVNELLPVLHRRANSDTPTRRDR